MDINKCSMGLDGEPCDESAMPYKEKFGLKKLTEEFYAFRHAWYVSVTTREQTCENLDFISLYDCIRNKELFARDAEEELKRKEERSARLGPSSFKSKRRKDFQ